MTLTQAPCSLVLAVMGSPVFEGILGFGVFVMLRLYGFRCGVWALGDQLVIGRRIFSFMLSR